MILRNYGIDKLKSEAIKCNNSLKPRQNCIKFGLPRRLSLVIFANLPYKWSAKVWVGKSCNKVY
jgi:hypothetical protein